MIESQNKQRWSWLALRTARDQYLQHFGRIGTGDVALLVQEIEKERVAEREKMHRADEVTSTIDEANSRTPVPETSTIHESQPATIHDDQGTNFEGADGQP